MCDLFHVFHLREPGQDARSAVSQSVSQFSHGQPLTFWCGFSAKEVCEFGIETVVADSERSLYEYLKDQCIFATPTSEYERCGHYLVGLSVYYCLLFFHTGASGISMAI